jgi:hypothetical protein
MASTVMTHALPSGIPRVAAAAAHAVGAHPNAVFAMVAAVVLACGVGIAMMPSPPASAATAHAPPAMADDQPSLPLVRWGVLESVRTMPSVADGPNAFEFTIRLRDRSTRIARGVGRAQWHVGDRIMLMGGGSPADPR